MAPGAMRRLAAGDGVAGNMAFEKGIFPSLSSLIPPPRAEETFLWEVRPPGGVYCGTTYTDGSRQDGRDPRLGRNGWAFTVKNATGSAVASAYGVPPGLGHRYPGH